MRRQPLRDALKENTGAMMTRNGRRYLVDTMLVEEDTAVSSTSATTVLSFAKATYRAAFIKVVVTQGSAYQSGKYSLIHDGTTVTVVEENAIATGSMLGSFSGTISGDNVLFQVTMGSASSATVTILKDLVTV